MSRISRLLAGLLLLGVLAACNDGAAATGTIKISVQDWSGVYGYRLLAGVWDDSPGARDLVGGAFWTMVDSDPFSTEDVVHPPYLGDDEPDDGDGWGAGDYLWDETARLEPGTT